jgi:hypothetical protein
LGGTGGRGPAGPAAGGAAAPAAGVSAVTSALRSLARSLCCVANATSASVRSCIIAIAGAAGAITGGGNTGGNGAKVDPLALLRGEGDLDRLSGGGGLPMSQFQNGERPWLGSPPRKLLDSSSSVDSLSGVGTSGTGLFSDGGGAADRSNGVPRRLRGSGGGLSCPRGLAYLPRPLPLVASDTLVDSAFQRYPKIGSVCHRLLQFALLRSNLFLQEIRWRTAWFVHLEFLAPILRRYCRRLRLVGQSNCRQAAFRWVR